MFGFAHTNSYPACRLAKFCTEPAYRGHHTKAGRHHDEGAML